MDNNAQVLMIDIDSIIPNRFQPRLTFDETELNNLANSIKEHGIIQPLVLRRLNDKYEIIKKIQSCSISRTYSCTSNY